MKRLLTLLTALAICAGVASADEGWGAVTVFDEDTSTAGSTVYWVNIDTAVFAYPKAQFRQRPEWFAFLLQSVDRYAAADSLPYVRVEGWYGGMPFPLGADSTILKPNLAATAGDSMGYYTRRAIPPQVDSVRVTIEDPTATGGWLRHVLTVMGVRVP